MSQSDQRDGHARLSELEKRFPQPVAAGALINRWVIEPLESQPILGRVRSVVRASDQTITLVIEYGGFLGFGTRPIAVPLRAVTLLSPQLVITGYTRAQLDGFPTFSAEGTTPLAADDIIRIGLTKPSH